MIVTTMQGDTVDALCQRHLGCAGTVTEQVFATNQGIAALGPVLPIGTQVTLPDQAPARNNNSIIQLWD